jgi:hypothetical protein
MNKKDLHARRAKLLRQLARVDQRIALTQKSLARIETRLAALNPLRERAA